MSQSTPLYHFLTLTHQNNPDDFANGIIAGLSAAEKYIDNKYMYNAVGSDLFEQITQDPGYYPTHAETEILRTYATDIIAHVANGTALVELGAGSAAKTRYLLEALLQRQNTTLFCPIDISGEFLQDTVKRLSVDYPTLQMLGIIGDYYSGLSALAERITQSKLLIWLGSDLGHTDRNSAAVLLQEKISPALQIGDKLLLGIDLKKAIEPLHRAYGCNDDVSNELRYRFNCNALHHINQQLGGNFVTTQFTRECFYNAEAGRVEIYLKSLCVQQVTLASLKRTFEFSVGERVRIHYAHKYDQEDILYLAKTAGMRLLHQWFDHNHFYSLNLFALETN